MPSSSAANLKNLAAGVDAQLYDGQSTVGRPIRLQLNLASLSQRASVDTINPVTQAVLASNSIQDFRVINPQRRARRRRDGELWLELRGAYVHIVHDDARLGEPFELTLHRWLRSIHHRFRKLLDAKATGARQTI